jgi:tetratricopeptide (TPR) repeat protein
MIASAAKPHLILAAVYLLLFVLLFYPWTGEGCDDVFYYSYLSSPFFDGDIDVLNDYYLSNNNFTAIRIGCSRIGPKGLLVNQFASGSALLWFPFFFPVRAVGWAANSFLSPPPAWANDRFSSPYLLAISLATLCYGFLTLVLLYAICRLLEFTPAVALCSSLGVVLGSSLLGYIFHYPGMSHTPSAFSVALLLYLSIRHRDFRALDSYMLIAAALALATLVRWQNILFGLIPAALWVERLGRRNGERSSKSHFLFPLLAAAVFLAIFSVQMFYWWAQVGKFLTIPQGGGFMHWRSPEMYRVLFGWHGLYYFHPLFLLATGGFLIFLCGAKQRVLGAVLILCVALMTYVNAAAGDWWAGTSFGARRFCSTVPLFAVGLAAFYSLFRARLILVPIALTGVAIAANVFLLAVFVRGIADPVSFNEFWLLRMDWIRLFPEWIRSVHLDSLAWVYLFLTGKYAKGILLLLLGASLLFGLLVGVLKNAFLTLESKARFVIFGFMGVVAVLDLTLLLRPPAVNADGIAFARAISRRGPIPEGENREIISQLIRAKYSNPFLYCYALEILGDKSSLPGYLDAVYEISPHVWGKWVEILPPSDVGDDLRRKAVRLRRPTFPSAFSFYTKTSHQLRWLRSGLRFNPFEITALRTSADIAMAKGRTREAEEFRSRLQRSLEAKVHSFFAVEKRLDSWKPTIFSLYYLNPALELGKVYEENDQVGQAIALYENVARLAPSNLFVRQRLLVLHAHRNDVNVDEKVYRRLLDNPQTLVDTFVRAARLSLKAQTPQRAVAELTIGFKHYPDDASLGYWLNAALQAFEPNDIPFDDLLAANLTSFQYWLVVANHLNAANRFADAVKVMERFVPELSRDPWACFVYGFALHNTKRPAEAEAFLRKAFDASPDFIECAICLARCLLGQGKRDAAIEIIDQALKRNPSDKQLEALREEAQTTK